MPCSTNPLLPVCLQVMEQDLKPQLQKLELQMQQHAEYSNITANVEKLRRFLMAFDYWTCSK